MTRVAILGAAGYTGLELIKILLRHPEVEITALADRLEGQPHVATIHPSLIGRLDLRLETLTPAELAARAECVFCCLPHGVSATIVPQLLDAGVKVIDLSADYRLSDPETYAAWYNQKHPDPGRLGKVAYGLPELFREQIRGSSLVANPGCFPTSAILALAPLLKAGLIEPRGIIVDSKTGVSGAGRSPKLTTHYPECNESVSAYNIGRHRHTPEMDQILSKVAGEPVEVIFSPHLIPMDRGILTTTYSVPRREVTEDELFQTVRSFYANEPFVRVVPHLPATKDSLGTNFCDITVRTVRGRIVTISCIDNLIKGASGAAVQNFNIVYDYPETVALL
ncbi:MAG: N-acetyl-gamma-glutamyl-phosphate reductase [Thermoguttaceae bacterium]|nr:N-acetyl-gamma-glutamyl-phosphate reductase [Thermoguttaceae bacterium]MDW8079229.1 N-acetyl-gamma-glutamyl-phosphate reductase [Thermoguttaceae bacterium]